MRFWAWANQETMSRAARRRAEREAARVGGIVEQKPPQMIQLSNPVTEHFGAFIFGNSLRCEHVVLPGDGEGRTVTICGAGPSLAEDAADWIGKTDDLWAANSALTWLIDNGYNPTHAITVDQTAAMVNEWRSAPDVEYLVASTIHPHLTDMLLAKGRKLRFFHNFVGLKQAPVEWCECGHDHEERPNDNGEPTRLGCSDDACDCVDYRPRVISYEDWLYITLYPGSVRVGSGLNTVTRAIDLALIMGYDKINVLGADCALRVNRPLPRHVNIGSDAHRAWLQNETVMHADGGNALASGATSVTLGGEIDGRWWETKPDMAISAVFMMRMQEEIGEDRLFYVGDTLPNALKGKPDEFINSLPALIDSNGDPLVIKKTEPMLT